MCTSFDWSSSAVFCLYMLYSAILLNSLFLERGEKDWIIKNGVNHYFTSFGNKVPSSRLSTWPGGYFSSKRQPMFLVLAAYWRHQGQSWRPWGLLHSWNPPVQTIADSNRCSKASLDAVMEGINSLQNNYMRCMGTQVSQMNNLRTKNNNSSTKTTSVYVTIIFHRGGL